MSYKKGYFWLTISLCFVFIATISPFNFVILNSFSLRYISEQFIFGSHIKDYWQNVLLFVPFGFSISGIINYRQKIVKTIIISLLISFVLSVIVELSQLFLPSRVSNLSDIICNSTGGLIGSILFYFKNGIIHFTIAIFTGNIKQIKQRSILISIFIYCSIISLAVFVLINSVNLNNWNSNYYLAIGNEVTGVRPWQGRIKSLYISDRSFNPLEITDFFRQPNSFLNKKLNSIVAFVFDRDRENYQNESQQLINLVWQKRENSNIINTNIQNIASTNNFITVDSQQWLKSQLPATVINNSLKNKDEFTLIIRVASNNINLGGPARIIALSKGIYAHNLLIGQQKSDLHFRLRTPITGRSAVKPEFIIPNVFKDTSFHNIVITFNRRTLSFYIDRLGRQYSFTFNPYNSYTVFAPWDYPVSWSINLQNFSDTRYKITFYAIISIPFLFLVTILIWKINIVEQNY